ncbi:MAG: type IX secretion system membrane protein PorP/SprF [Flavobacteriales bacterium]|nr:type IX secretion system membrane protein PorP/SprF [Flavobacteriales bacterium]
MKKLVFSALLFGMTLAASAQQDPQFTQFFNNKLIMNPAYAGSKDAICITMLGRFQWVGFDGAPTSALLSGDLPVWNKGSNQIAVGLTTYLDYIGFEKNYALRVAGTYRRKNLGPGHLAVGFDIGFSNKGIENPTWIYPSGMPDPNIPASGSSLNNFGFDLGLGVYYHTDNWYAGISAIHLTGSDFADINIRQARHMFFMGGYTFKSIAGSDFDLNPNVLIKTEFATAQFDANLNVIWREFYWGGLTYRIQDAVAINLGMNFGAITPKLNGLQIGYSYDINTSRLSSFNTGSHEIMLRYCFKLNKEQDIIRRYNVRFMDYNKDRF